MKKFFTFFAVMLFALTVNAAIEPGTGALKTAIEEGSDAVIELNSGNYTETAVIAITRNVTIKAANMASRPVVSTKGFTISGGVTVKFKGIKLNASGISDNVIVANDGNANSLELDSCDMYNMGTHYGICAVTGKHFDLLKVTNCYFYDSHNSAIFSEQTKDPNPYSRIEVRNSTFANFTVSEQPVIIMWSGNDAFAENIEDDPVLIVDHCTFYNYIKDQSNTYSFIDSRRSKNVTISNNIFMNPTIPDGKYNAKATQAYAGTISNNILYGVENHRSGPSISGDIKEDPLFVDAANGDFRLKADYTSGGEVSPAIGAATDGSNLGDPNRGVKYTYYTTDFAGGYAFTAAVAAISSSSLESNEHYGVDNPYLRYTGSTSTDAIASWVIQATRACYVNVTVDLVDNSWNYSTDNTYQNGKHIFGVEIWNSNNVRVDTVGEGTYEHGSSLDGYNDTYPTVGLGQLYIPAAGVYTVKLLNKRSWSKCGVGSVTFTYCEPIDVYLKVGLWDDAGATEGYAVYDNTNKCWSKFMTVEDADMKLYTTKILADATTVQFHRVDGSATHPRDGKWNSSGDQSKASNRDLWTVTDWNNSGNWNKYLPSLTQDSYYLCGTMNNWIPNADGLFTLNKEGEYKLNTTLAEGDEFKAVLVNNKIIDSYYPGGSDPNYVVGSSKAGSVTIYLRPAGGGDGTWHCGTLYVEKTATSLSDINAADQAVKRLENGQLVIFRGENAYTVTGVRIR